ncbi:MAG: GDSL-type esterase/lipase family protein, partial [Pseudomonadota bacterium]|nr:GDSL-type esterase/lipase family protein [Pseudomonadota bacterium]
THRHADYSVTYQIDSSGLRADPEARDEFNDLIIGDSFTFGLGVTDGQTFVSRLNGAGGRLRNAAVPGYATDQELLWLRELLGRYRPRRVILAVYLGNDFFDNALPFPLQAAYGKPFFELREGTLHLRNQPVPRSPKSATVQEQDVRRLMSQGRSGHGSWWIRAAAGTKLGQLLLALLPARSPEALPQAQWQLYAPYVALFEALLRETERTVVASGAELLLVTLPGHSYVLLPWSYAAVQQELFRQAVVTGARDMSIPVVDVARALRQSAKTSRGRNWFFANDGHLTPEGHIEVAEQLRALLQP